MNLGRRTAQEASTFTHIFKESRAKSSNSMRQQREAGHVPWLRSPSHARAAALRSHPTLPSARVAIRGIRSHNHHMRQCAVYPQCKQRHAHSNTCCMYRRPLGSLYSEERHRGNAHLTYSKHAARVRKRRRSNREERRQREKRTRKH